MPRPGSPHSASPPTLRPSSSDCMSCARWPSCWTRPAWPTDRRANQTTRKTDSVELTYLQAALLGIVEGLTEFLPVSSTGHLTITEKLLGLTVDDPAVTAYTAIIQMGAIAAVIVYF